jgi:hypothetical protein
MMALKSRGADGGPKWTLPHLGDALWKQASYDVEEVGIDVAVFIYIYPPNSGITVCTT